MRYEISNFEYLKQRLAECADDDLTLPWQTYPCLLWDRGKFSQGYGAIWLNGTTRHVHAVAYEIVRGPFETGCFGCHHCDIRLCFRPIHIFAGDDAANAADMVAKGRANRAYGERAAKAKLTQSDIMEIIRLHSNGTSRIAIAKKFGVTKSNIGHIFHGRTWRSMRKYIKETKQ